jgi:hypothetical protein
MHPANSTTRPSGLEQDKKTSTVEEITALLKLDVDPRDQPFQVKTSLPGCGTPRGMR